MVNVILIYATVLFAVMKLNMPRLFRPAICIDLTDKYAGLNAEFTSQLLNALGAKFKFVSIKFAGADCNSPSDLLL